MLEIPIPNIINSCSPHNILLKYYFTQCICSNEIFILIFCSHYSNKQKRLVIFKKKVKEIQLG